MLTALALVMCFQGGADGRAKEAEVIEERAFAAADEAGKAESEAERKRAWERATAEFRKVVKDYADARTYGMCHYNLGHILCNELERYEEAITELRALIASKVDDRDKTGALMHPFRNYRYNAWRQITTCYEKLKRPGYAVQAVFGARKAYVADCGTCQTQMLERSRGKLVELVQGIAPAVEAADVDKALERERKQDDPKQDKDAPPDPTAEQFLAALQRRLDGRGKRDDARKVLRVLAAEFATSDEGKAAAKALAEREQSKK